jgi:diaminopimelate epimerase
MNGLGNDFVVVAHFETLPSDAKDMAMLLCNRNFGIGADGLVFILPSKQADFCMRIINADGSEPEQCGNAIRCVAKYVYDHHLTEKMNISIETLAGIQHVSLTVEGEKAANIRVDMGSPILHGPDIPVALTADQVVEQPISVENKNFAFTGVSMGNPHAVIFVEDAPGFAVEEWGPLLENHAMFPRKANIEFVSIRSANEVDMRVWERGCGQTLACGTGACATAVAGVLAGKTDRSVLVHLKGGDLRIEWSLDGPVYMTGPAEEVFAGEWKKGAAAWSTV